MPRLSAAQWEKARADYEIRGISLGEVARKYGVSQQAVSLQAKKNLWQQGKTCELVKRKVAVVRELAAVERETCDLSQVEKYTMDDFVKEQLRSEGLLVSLTNQVALKALAMVQDVSVVNDLEALSRIRKNLAPQTGAQTTVNVQQAQVQSQKSMSPEEICKKLIEEQELEIAAETGSNG